MAAPRVGGQRTQLQQRQGDGGPVGQQASGIVEHALVAVEMDQGVEALSGGHGEIARQLLQLGAVLGSQCRIDAVQPVAIDRYPREHAADDAGIGQIEHHLSQAGDAQAFERDAHDLEIGLESRLAVDLGTELQGFAAGAVATGASAQYRPAVAKPRHAFAVEQVGIDAGHLRRSVRTQAEGAAAGLVDQLEGFEIEGVAGAGQQRFDVLEQRRNDQLEAGSGSGVEKAAAQDFDVPRLGRQDVGDVLRQEPGRGHAGWRGY